MESLEEIIEILQVEVEYARPRFGESVHATELAKALKLAICLLGELQDAKSTV